MATTLRDTLQARLDAYLAAEAKILAKQEYTIGDGSTARRIRYADLPEVRATIDSLTAQIQRLDAQSSGARRVMYTRPAY
jgi:hypothetical protein